jgi:hypothetical protein
MIIFSFGILQQGNVFANAFEQGERPLSPERGANTCNECKKEEEQTSFRTLAPPPQLADKLVPFLPRSGQVNS